MANLMMRSHFYLFFLFVFCLAGTAAAQEKTVDEADVQKAEKYFQDLKTAQARFVQTTHNGNQMVGTFYLSRPGKLRFEYDPPLKDFIVADGAFIYFYDGEMEEQTNAPIGTSLADFFLRKDFTLHGDLTVRSTRRDAGFLQLEVVQTDDPDAGTLTFAFTEEPFVLKKWRIVDGQGGITEVELFYLKAGIELEKSLFYYSDPRKKEKDYKPSYND